MKKQVTKKYIKENFKNIIVCGYCEAHYLLQHRQADYYTAGLYRWDFDAYIIDLDTILITGYRPIKGIRIKNIREIEAQAKENYKKYSKYETIANKNDNLLIEAICDTLLLSEEV